MQTAGKAGFALFCIPQSHIGGRASKRQTLSAVYARRMCPFPASGRSGTVQKTTRSAYSVSFAGKAVHPFTSFSLGGRSIAQFAQKVKPHPLPAHKPADCNRGLERKQIGSNRVVTRRQQREDAASSICKHISPKIHRAAGRDGRKHGKSRSYSGFRKARRSGKPVPQQTQAGKGRAAAERRICTPAALPSRRSALGNRPLSAAAVPTACRSNLSSGLFLVPFPMALKRACTSASRAKRDVPRKGDVSFCGSHPSATSSSIINAKPNATPTVPTLLCSPACDSGISSSTTT